MLPHKTLAICNQSELVQLLGDRGVRTHPGVPKEALLRALIEELPVEEGENPFDPERMRIMGFLERNAKRLTGGQVKCHTRCDRHMDAKVFHCWLKSRKVILEEERG